MGSWRTDRSLGVFCRRDPLVWREMLDDGGFVWEEEVEMVRRKLQTTSRSPRDSEAGGVMLPTTPI